MYYNDNHIKEYKNGLDQIIYRILPFRILIYSYLNFYLWLSYAFERNYIVKIQNLYNYCLKLLEKDDSKLAICNQKLHYQK